MGAGFVVVPCDVGGNEGGQGEGRGGEGGGGKEPCPLAFLPPRAGKGIPYGRLLPPEAQTVTLALPSSCYRGGHAKPSLGQFELGARQNKWCYLFT